MIDKLAKGQTVRWQGEMMYESARYATGVLTDTALFLNSAVSAKKTEDTELQLTLLKARVEGAQWQPLGLLRFFSFFIWGNFDHTVWLRLRDGESKRLFFRKQSEAQGFCAAVNKWIEEG